MDRLISPELALVDPELAEIARSGLADTWPEPRRASMAGVEVVQLLSDRVAPGVRGRSQTSYRALVGVAAVTVAALLFLDVRVDVGGKRALADSSTVDGGRPAVPPPAGQPPERPSTTPTERRFAWAPTPGAAGYHVEFFRNDKRVYASDTVKPQLTVPRRWTHEGRPQSFRPGEYRWYVWPVASGRRGSRAVIQTTVSIPGAQP